MGKQLKTADHGGNRKTFVSLRTGSARSLRCRDCDKLQYVARAAFFRSKAPRCYLCGGVIVETPMAQKKRTGLSAAQLKGGCPGVKPLRCPFCETAFRSEAGLNLHIRDNHGDE